MKRAEYKNDLPETMYSFFSQSPAGELPSFSKFARQLGITLEDLASFRTNDEFDRAWRECNEIRRDYLIDNALSKRCDASFSKFLYALEFPQVDGEGEDIKVTIEVLPEE